MGKNFELGAANLGQYGSIYSSAAASVIPPKGLVIVAINFLDANTPTVLRPEWGAGIKAPATFQCINTVAAAHDNGDAEQALSDASANTAHTLTGANADIKVGMQAFSNTEDLLENKSTGVGPCLVESVSGTAITFNRLVTASTTTITFSALHQTGTGGTAVSTAFPAGTWIYGRWTEVKPSNTTLGVICYLGK